MVTCNFCGKTIPEGSGKLYVKKDGKLFHFCSLKCEKNLIKLGRKPRNFKWTVEGQKAKGEK